MIPTERKAKIVATIGPASETEEALEKLLLAGMDVARLNFSHGTHEAHAARTVCLRRVSARLRRPLAILQDLQGPKIRVGVLPVPVTLTAGQVVLLHPESRRPPSIVHGQVSIPVDFPQLFEAVHAGDRILLDDGRLVLRAQAAGPASHRAEPVEAVTAEVVIGGELSSHKGINLPGVRLDIPAFTEKDADDLKFGLSLGVEAVALSFVQSAEDVQAVRAIVKAGGENSPLLIAKLERPAALENLDEILEAVDGVMVARGDLGVEMPPEDVPGAQKRIIQEANRKGKIVITATQMLESMIHAPLPTRAEASDVANAVYDGTDAVMLSAETAVGAYPVESVAMMDRIVRQAEADADKWGRGQALEAGEHDDAAAIVRAARELAHDRDVEAIAVFTRSGRTAVLMSKARPCVPVLAFTPVEETYRRLALAWGVTPHIVPFADTVEAMIAHVEASLKESGLVHPGGQVVLVTGFPVSEFRLPNMALLHTVK
ncbi:MAG: pyruvate kinase [Anaerolineaceae bacterium]|nr:MAG: pyruvate kinase [Anaerolineaceae bacterium]